MPSPGSSAVVTDLNGVPAAQGWDNVAQTYFYEYGDSTRGETFTRQAPIVPYKIGAYTNAATVKSSAGTFFGAYGQYNSSSANAWIMVFDASSAPSTGTAPLAATAVGPTSGPDNNWFIAPGKPYSFSTGLYIALSTTGGTFTASSSNNLTGTVEYI